MRPFTNAYPKPFLPLMGVPLIQLVFDQLRDAGVNRVMVNSHAHFDRANELLKNLDLKGLSVEVSDESKLLLGSAGGIRKALPFFRNQPFLIVNADTLSSFDLSALRLNAPLTLTLLENPNTGGKYREVLTEQERVKGIGDFTFGKKVFTGISVVEPRIFEHLPLNEPSDFLKQVLLPLIDQKSVGYCMAQGKWFDIGEPLQWKNAHFDAMKFLDIGGIPDFWMNRWMTLNTRASSLCWSAKGTSKIQEEIPGYYSEDLRITENEITLLDKNKVYQVTSANSFRV
jgi:N-acetyl-alpha-D-muramate 1-phosphate uridylyltransferase